MLSADAGHETDKEAFFLRLELAWPMHLFATFFESPTSASPEPPQRDFVHSASFIRGDHDFWTTLEMVLLGFFSLFFPRFVVIDPLCLQSPPPVIVDEDRDPFFVAPGWIGPALRVAGRGRSSFFSRIVREAECPSGRLEFSFSCRR